MLASIEEDVPEFLQERSQVAFCSQLHVKRNKSSLVLARNLKFYEFRQKQLVHHLDLSQTALQRYADELQQYNGPVSSFLMRGDVADTSTDATNCSMLHDTELPLSIGKYIWLGEHIYVLLRCWQTLLVLRRPKEQAAQFTLIAEHEQLADYRLVRGPIKYQAYVELSFSNGQRQRTNFQTADSAVVPAPTTGSQVGFKRLMQRVHSARAELHVQRAQTQQDFVRVQQLQAYDAPAKRSLLLEEKQLLRRYGDVWTRICGEALILGTVLCNSAGSSRLTMLHDIRPLLQLPNGVDGGLNYTHCLYELPLQASGQPPEDYAELAQFWACQQQRSSSLNWRKLSCAMKLPPERSAVLLLRLPLHALLDCAQLQLFALYELRDAQCTRQLQLQLASINIEQLLASQEQHVPSFAAQTLHQDFLAITHASAHCVLRLQFESTEQQSLFEQLLAKWGFECSAVPQLQQLEQHEQQQQRESKQSLQPLDDTCLEREFQFGNSTCSSESESVRPTSQQLFYHKQSLLLLLHTDPAEQWEFYAPNELQLCLLLRRCLRELLQLRCNLSLLQLQEQPQLSSPANAALLLESALRAELLAKSQQAHNCQELELASDLLIAAINKHHN
ncbi:CG9114 [Drosophila busckii]|uniref:CG9114 n=1 Tax=Drosophila busckii TaxID=30019 RepID=A0A0M3QZB3_DROBS|nr:uncharacterized protein LOC108605084 [Drosophila busckii]ALC49123.1 CG9114 [Drosophila busckii]